MEQCEAVGELYYQNIIHQIFKAIIPQQKIVDGDGHKAPVEMWMGQFCLSQIT